MKLIAKENDFELLNDYFKKAINNTANNNDIKLKLYPAFRDWAEYDKSIYQEKIQQRLARWEKVQNIFSDYIEPIFECFKLALALDDTEKMSAFLNLAKNISKSDFHLTTMLFLYSHHTHDWVNTKKYFLLLKDRYPKDYDRLYIWYFFEALLQLQEERSIESYYIEYVKTKYFQILEMYPSYDFIIEKIQIAQFLNNFQLENLYLSELKNHELSFKFPYPQLHPKQIKVINHDLDNDTLLVIFAGLGENNPYKVYNPYRLEKLDLLIEDFDTEYSFTFHNFAKKNTQYNYLLLNDIYNSWYQLHTNEFIEVIKNTISELRAKKVVCLGGSAGGFASLIFGQLINADLVFSFSPQGSAIAGYEGPYTKDLQLQFYLGIQETASINKMQQKFQGFKPQCFITFAKHNGADSFAIQGLDKSDKNLHLVSYKGNEHAIIQYIGTSHVFKDMCEIIDNYGDFNKISANNLFLTKG